MTEAQAVRCRKRLEQFLVDLLEPVGRRERRPPTAARYGEQRPTTAQEAARQAQGWRTIRWREGSTGWWESRFWATRVQPSHRYQDGRPPGKEVW
ncbi:MAG: hypothetical protein A3J28_08795 [Acidobacteria bacterium RIFCSPLOWO2_12_FULL_60_22]|nr:MAG: hypothetical protein A3J28_08795 [Acidobacteria bacterium RIFCSPLOWO2_12_FULL_60_22]